MEKPVDIGTKTIDASTVHLIRELTPERLGSLAQSGKNFTVEIRGPRGAGGFVEDKSVKEVVAFFAGLGEQLTILPKSGDGPSEAIRTAWVQSVKDFNGREGEANKYQSVVAFRDPKSGETTEEWLAAKRNDVMPNTPSLSGPGRNGPGGAN